MSVNERKILEALESSGKEGRGVISLSLETGYSQSVLRRFFKKHKQFCVPLNGQTKYKLSQFTNERGSVDEMVATIERHKTEARVSASFSYGLLAGLFIANIGNFIDVFF
ncbi:hypothetical protein ISG33_02695 [Glaciecola sp. MH2013]|uniref:hypothetical protein n=1 Tax=Glaciecola sp. MH2013 TaxID=2785524 RepID=UPI00189CDC05|nr:hypothetical protein [Glaciecola sp. MH2013]MBF7072311.1 hypothetical protein [Glaciecola sp. MH2013]